MYVTKVNAVIKYVLTRISGRQDAPNSSCSLRSHQCGGVCQVEASLTLFLHTDTHTQKECSFIYIDVAFNQLLLSVFMKHKYTLYWLVMQLYLKHVLSFSLPIMS